MSLISFLVFALLFGCNNDKSFEEDKSLEVVYTPASYVATSAKQTISIAYTANQKVTVKSLPDWCTVKSFDNTTITLDIDANTSSSSRVGQVYIGTPKEQVPFEITQRSKVSSDNGMTLSDRSFSLNEAGGQFDFTLLSDKPFEIKIEERFSSWITNVGVKSIKSSTVSINVSKNITGAVRSGYVVVDEGVGNNSDTLYITQSGGNSPFGFEIDLSMAENNLCLFKAKFAIASLGVNEKVSEVGLCYSYVTPYPNVDDYRAVRASFNSTGNQTATLDGSLSGFIAATKYYVRPYAKTNRGVYYGDSKSVTTPIVEARPAARKVVDVIFHVLYFDPKNMQFNVRREVLDESVAYANMVLRNQINPLLGADSHLEARLATHSPSGELLAEPGISRVKWPEDPILNVNEFMESEVAASSNMFWDVHRYVNVWVFAFTEDNVAGISYLPFVPSANPISGLNNGDYYITNPVTNHFGICLNSRAFTNGTNTPTFAHEFCHFYGLYHVFSEAKSGCVDSDYCTDTPTYDRDAYERNVVNNGYNRTSCSGQGFVSHNLMDYYITYSDIITPQQVSRIDHVLNYGVLNPQYGTLRSKPTYVDIYAEKPQMILMK